MNKYEKYRCLTDEQKAIRISIMDCIIDNGGSVNIELAKKWVKEHMESSEETIDATFKQFIDTNVMVVIDDEITFIFPVSGKSTNHRITLEDGRSFCAMCAIDSIGTSYTFKQPVTINSMCAATGKEIELKVDNGKVLYTNNPGMYIIHVDLLKNTDWANAC